jgi:AraC family transcriptional regulator of adaptative response / DNA-3-methyladenine glycosylase II
VCEQARLSRDPRFDGLFFTGVTSTRIYCRPVCPAPAPKPRNIIYYPSAAAAEAAGFRPCLRCRPELAPGDGAWRRGDDAMARALKLIDAGLLAEQPLASLAERVHWASASCDACSSNASVRHRAACMRRGACCSPSSC